MRSSRKTRSAIIVTFRRVCFRAMVRGVWREFETGNPDGEIEGEGDPEGERQVEGRIRPRRATRTAAGAAM